MHAHTLHSKDNIDDANPFCVALVMFARYLKKPVISLYIGGLVHFYLVATDCYILLHSSMAVVRVSSLLLVAFAAVSLAAPSDATASSPPTDPETAKFWFPGSPYTYCDAVFPSADSYEPLPNAELKMVQVVVRHGDRSPVHLIPHDKTRWTCDKIVENMSLHAAGQLKTNSTGSFTQVIEIPEWNKKYGFSNQVWQGSCEVGQLTYKGKNQHHNLGSHLRNIYVDKLGFLDPVASHNSLYARSTYVQRTKDSAESLIGGLWPNRDPVEDPPIPLHSYPQAIETMFSNSNACPKIGKLFDEISQSPQHQRFLKKHGPLMARLEGIFGVSGKGWSDNWDGYIDVLWARKCHGKKLPCSGQSNEERKYQICASDQDADQANMNANFEWALKFRDHPLAKNLTRLAIGNFVGTLTEQIRSKIAGKEGDLKFALYSGHDTTVAPLLGVLKADNYNMMWPPYASNIVFELWKEKRTGRHVVRVVYNGKTLKLQHQHEWCNMESCPVEDFYKYLDGYIPSDIVTECAIH